MIIFKRYSCLLIFIITTVILFTKTATAQSVYTPLGTETYDIIDRFDIKYSDYNNFIFTTTKPYKRKDIISFVKAITADSSTCVFTDVDRFNLTYLIRDNSEWAENPLSLSNRQLLKPFYKEKADLISIGSKEYMFKVSPVINFDFGKEAGSTNYKYFNTRGAEIRGGIDNKVGFYTYLTDNQAVLPLYINKKRIAQDNVLSGEGWQKNFKNGGTDFFTARGYITFNATKHIDVQFGQDKNFLGNGYRSVLLSDYSNNYLFLRLNTQAGPVHYQNLFCELLDYPTQSSGSNLYVKKYATIQKLDVRIMNNLTIGAFENVIFSRGNVNGTKGGFDFQYLNPIIFYTSIEHTIGDNDNVGLGFDWKYNFLKTASFYGQVYIDDFNFTDLKMELDTFLVKIKLKSHRSYTKQGSYRDKFGFQGGFKYIDVGGIDNLDAQVEYNLVMPYTYSHYDVTYKGAAPQETFSHYRQPLAHPLGANFKEWVLILRYQPIFPLTVTVKWFEMIQGLDSSNTNFGSNIFLDYESHTHEYGNKLCQGVKVKTQLADMMVSYQLKHNIYADLRYIFRFEKSDKMNSLNLRTSYITLGLRLNFATRKFDY